MLGSKTCDLSTTTWKFRKAPYSDAIRARVRTQWVENTGTSVDSYPRFQGLTQPLAGRTPGCSPYVISDKTTVLLAHNIDQDVESWCPRCSICGQCKAAVCGYEQLQQPTYCTFNESRWIPWVSSNGPRTSTITSLSYRNCVLPCRNRHRV